MNRRQSLPLLLLLAGALCACNLGRDERIRQTGGDPERGKQALVQYNCGACHTIPGIIGAQGRMGPPLAKLSAREQLRGNLTNEPANVIRWILEPRSIRPSTAMPQLSMPEQAARDMAAALYDLE